MPINLHDEDQVWVTLTNVANYLRGEDHYAHPTRNCLGCALLNEVDETLRVYRNREPRYTLDQVREAYNAINNARVIRPRVSKLPRVPDERLASYSDAEVGLDGGTDNRQNG